MEKCLALTAPLIRARRLFLIGLLIGLGGCSGPHGEPGSTKVCEGIATAGMVWVEGGTFTFGSNPHYPEEGPPREVEIEGFWISQTEVTNAQFDTFVQTTRYVTEAERDPPKIPGAPPEMSLPGSAVFRVPTPDNPNWWAWMPGANWQQPNGPQSTMEALPNEPVVQVTYNDALAYAAWAGLNLPTERQWEYAAAADDVGTDGPRSQTGAPTANFYQGVFPARDLGEDGYTSRAPVGCFEPNKHGLYDMLGNVWEWTSSSNRPDAATNVIKGGSFLCAANYCARYRPAARQFQERDLGTDHIGFRLVDNVRAAP